MSDLLEKIILFFMIFNTLTSLSPLEKPPHGSGWLVRGFEIPHFHY